MRKMYLVLAVVLLPSSALAEGFIAALAGPAIVTSEGGGNQASFGGRVVWTVGKDESAVSSLGFAVSTFSNSETISGVTVDASLTFLAAEYVARDAWGTGIYFGGRVGLSVSGATVTSGSTALNGSATAFAYAPVVGVEAPLGGNVKFVFDASWMNVSARDITIGTSTIPLDHSAALLLHVGLGIGF